MSDTLRGLVEHPFCCLCHKRFEAGDYAQGRNLRDRISDVASEHRFADHRIAFGDKCVCGWTSQEVPHSDHLADAVIAELGQQWRADFGYDGYTNCATRDEATKMVDDYNARLGDDVQDGDQAMVMHRYVTEWETDGVSASTFKSAAMECDACHEIYVIRADTPGWSSAWMICSNCQLGESLG